MKKHEQYVEAYKKYYRLVAVRAYAILGDAQTSHEIAQEAYMRLTMYIDDLANMDHVRMWLQRVAINLALDYVRAHKHHRVDSLDEETVADDLIEETDLTENFCMKILLKEVLKYVDSWDDLSAYIFRSKLNGLRNREISEHVGLRPEAVEDRYLKLRRRVCKKFYAKWLELDMPSQEPKKKKQTAEEKICD